MSTRYSGVLPPAPCPLPLPLISEEHLYNAASTRDDNVRTRRTRRPGSEAIPEGASGELTV